MFHRHIIETQRANNILHSQFQTQCQIMFFPGYKSKGTSFVSQTPCLLYIAMNYKKIISRWVIPGVSCVVYNICSYLAFYGETLTLTTLHLYSMDNARIIYFRTLYTITFSGSLCNSYGSQEQNIFALFAFKETQNIRGTTACWLD